MTEDDDVSLFVPNCPDDLTMCEPGKAAWVCPTCGLAVMAGVRT
jgi:hypothetical protein